ncbi:hypothetical protein ACRYCC_25105 [Actinomadura scrupuli]|uniref:hypothetical protein n=1 Tax=Actinomadura scrupuli TaxID=559629 RepID=UPI003D97A63D
MSVQPICEPDPYDPANALHVVPEVPGRPVPSGLVAIPKAEYDRIRRLGIARQMIETKEKAARGDFSGFAEVTDEERALGELDA